MSRRLFLDVEEALSREIRRITFFSERTKDSTILQETFDPITGEIIQKPVEARFYDSSADTRNIQYPHFFVKLLRSREDRYTGRVTTQYGADQGYGCTYPVEYTYKAYERVLYSTDGVINSVGNNIQTTVFNISKVQVGYYIRLLSGNNKGTYTISSITRNDSSPHIITVSNDLILNLPAISFNSNSRVITFLTRQDLNTIKVGDVFRDSSSADYSISDIDIENNSITVTGTTTPSLILGGKIYRSGNVFSTVDTSLVNFIVMDPSKPIEGGYTSEEVYNASIPIDLYYLIRIDSKQRDDHIDILNRMWEEFNPPRTGLPVVIRSADSAEQLFTADVSSGGSSTIQVADNSKFDINDLVYIFNDFTPTKSSTGGFEELFAAKVINKIGTDQIVLDSVVSDSFKVENNSKIVSNASLRLLMFHFVDHITKDVEGAQYWVHEFTFWVQGWIDRLGEPTQFDGVIQSIETPLEDLQGFDYTIVQN